MKITNSTKRKTAVIIAVVALIITTLGATYAWSDYRQHKSNELSGTGGKYEARLVEDFAEVDNWTTDMCPVVKKISVANVGKASDGFGSVYVRMQLKEYMDISAITYTQTDKRFMIDTQGQFIIYATEAQAQAVTAPGGLYAGHSYSNLTDAVTKKSGYFIMTQPGDPNGQMGKHVVTNITTGNPVKVITNGPDRAVNVNFHGTVDSNGDFVTKSDECDYTVHAWDGSTLETRQYIQWGLNDNSIIKLSQWNGLPVAKWIIDDMSGSGWVYWGQALGTEDITADFLENVSLIKQPEGSFYYVIHTDMEAVSLDEILSGNVDWDGYGDKLKDNVPTITFGQTPTSVKVGEFVNAPTVTVGPANAAQTPLAWTSSNTSLATVDPVTGRVTGVSAGGPVTISVMAPNGAKGNYTLMVAPADVVVKPATNVTINGGDKTLNIGDTYTPGCVVTPTDSTDVPSWSSSDPTKATVDQNTGKITGVAEGTAVITVTAGSKTASITITVVSPPPDNKLPVKDPNDGNGYKPLYNTDPMAGDGWFGSYQYTTTGGDIVHLFHNGAIHLEDIIADGNYNGVTVTTIDPKYASSITIGADQHNKLSVIFSYIPTETELKALLGTLPNTNTDFYIPVNVTLTRGAQSAVVTINMYYWQSLLMYDNQTP